MTDALGNLVRFVLLQGQRYDTIGVAPLIEEITFDALIADKAFNANWIINEANERGAQIVISQRPNRKAPIEIDEEIYKWRHLSASDVARALNGVTPALMVSDPPYGVAYDPSWRARAGVNLNPGKLGKVTNDHQADWSAAWALFPGNVAYVWHAGKFAALVQASLERCEFEVRSQIIWAKDRFALSRGDYHWQHEPCWYAVRRHARGGWSGDRSQSTLWTIPSREDRGLGHGTQKPVECMRRPIANNSSPGQAVYDPFVGSGTTIIAGEMTGRSVHAIELNPAYVDVAVIRWQSFTGRAAILEATGESFEATVAARSAGSASSATKTAPPTKRRAGSSPRTLARSTAATAS